MEKVKIKTLIKQIRGVSYKPEDLHEELDENSVILLRANNIDDGKINFDDVVYVDKGKVSKEQYLRMGDVLICASSGSKNLVGKAASVIFERECTFGAFCKVVRPNDGFADYLGIYFQSPIYRLRISEVAIGANINNIRNEHINELDIPLYSYNERGNIVKKMQLIQGVINKRKEEIRCLGNLIKARFIEMFGDTVTNPLGWEEHRLDEYIDFLTSGSRGWAQYFVDEENELFITIKNVKNNHITLDNIQYIDVPDNKEAERTKVKTGDLLISITADLGRTGVVDDEIAEKGAYINQHLALVRLNQTTINPLYVSYFLETEGGRIQFESKNQNGVKAGLNFDAIKSLKILVPPLDMQESYLDFVKQVNKSKLILENSLSTIRKIISTADTKIILKGSMHLWKQISTIY